MPDRRAHYTNIYLIKIKTKTGTSSVVVIPAYPAVWLIDSESQY